MNLHLHLVDQFTPAEHWMCPIEYGDYTGLDITIPEELL